MRGEYPFDWAIGRTPWELPPRARRILETLKIRIIPRGTTSACAENTSPLALMVPLRRNYLRVRGEYGDIITPLLMSLELPPRARRIPKRENNHRCGGGTTSACAENTPDVLIPWRWCWNYLRVRGEYCRPVNTGMTTLELPPRARRIRRVERRHGWEIGTTSACAENTLNELGLL